MEVGKAEFGDFEVFFGTVIWLLPLDSAHFNKLSAGGTGELALFLDEPFIEVFG